MEIDAPLDFETEDLDLEFPPLISNNGRSKKSDNLISLDQLVSEQRDKKKNEGFERKSKKAKLDVFDSSDDEEDLQEKQKMKDVTLYVTECEKKVNDLLPPDRITETGQRIFGVQRSQTYFDVPKVEEWPLMQVLLSNNDIRSLNGLAVHNGVTPMLEILTGGWLPTMVLSRGHCDETTLRWSFNLMLYSSNDKVEMAACDFLCKAILSGSVHSQTFCILEWIPSYSDFFNALRIYGYLDVCETNDETDLDEDFENEGPPKNIRSWVKLVATCCQIRTIRTIFTVEEAENLVVTISRFSLDNILKYLNMFFQESLSSVIGYFTEEEWQTSSVRISRLLCQSLLELDFNSLRLVDFLSGASIRLKQLKRDFCNQLLIDYLSKQKGISSESADASQVIESLASINFRNKEVDFAWIFACLSLADAWLWENPSVAQNSLVIQRWLQFLRNCSCQIGSSDFRAFASKVRNRASFLLQNYQGQK